MSLQSVIERYGPMLDELREEIDQTRELALLTKDAALLAESDDGVKLVDRIVEVLLRLPSSQLNAREGLELMASIARATYATTRALQAHRARLVQGNG